MIYIIDYGAGNLKSVFHAFKNFTDNLKVVENISQIGKDIKAIILPGDGSFPFAFAELTKRGFTPFIKKNINEIPLLGICVGFQLLFESSDEDGGSEGLALLKGKIKKFNPPPPTTNEFQYKVPHMGWNQVIISPKKQGTKLRSTPLYHNITANDFFYFVHSYYAAQVNIIGWQAMVCNYIQPFCCGIVQDNIVGYQFHPEKSATAGIQLLKNFLQFFDLS